MWVYFPLQGQIHSAIHSKAEPYLFRVCRFLRGLMWEYIDVVRLKRKEGEDTEMGKLRAKWGES